MASVSTDLQLYKTVVKSFELLATHRSIFNFAPPVDNIPHHSNNNNNNDNNNNAIHAIDETEEEKQERLAKEEKIQQREASKERGKKMREKMKKISQQQRQQALQNAAKKNLIKELKQMPQKIPSSWEAHISPENGEPYYIDTDTGEWYRVNTKTSGKQHKRIHTNEKIHIVTMESIMTQSMQQFENDREKENTDTQSQNDNIKPEASQSQSQSQSQSRGSQTDMDIKIKEVQSYLELPQNWERKTEQNGKTYYVDIETGEWYRVNQKNKHKRIDTMEKIHIVTMESKLEFEEQKNKMDNESDNDSESESNMDDVDAKQESIPNVSDVSDVNINSELRKEIKEIQSYLDLPQNWERKTDENGKIYYVDVETGEWYRVNSGNRHKRIDTNEKLHIITMESIMAESKKQFDEEKKKMDNEENDDDMDNEANQLNDEQMEQDMVNEKQESNEKENILVENDDDVNDQQQQQDEER